MGAPHTRQEIKNAIMERLANGEIASALAKEFSINVATIYNWVYTERKNAEGGEPKKSKSIDEQIEELTHKYVADLQALMARKFMAKLLAT
jgi:transposase-like protein